MRNTISFDLDDTLIGCDGPVEPLGMLGKILKAERLRLGTRNLFRELRSQSFSVGIYTSSYRPHSQIKNTFRCHGLKLDRIVSGPENEVAIRGTRLSKRPSAFGFEVHVDDAPIGSESDYQSTVIVIEKNDPEWDKGVLMKLQSLTEQVPEFADADRVS